MITNGQWRSSPSRSCSARRSRAGWCTVARVSTLSNRTASPRCHTAGQLAGQVPGPAIKQIYRETGRRNRDHIVEEFASVARMIR